MRIATYSRTFQILNENNIHIKKKYGQNFIIDPNIINRIVDSADIDENTGVIEIGPGIGALTEGLLLKAKKVVAFEIDNTIIDILKNNLKDFDNLDVINQDFLKIDLNKTVNDYFDGCSRVVIVSNLPYYITTPILLKIFESNSSIYSVTVMMQKEVATRIVAHKGGKEYNNLSILCSYYGDPKVALQVSKNIFVPRPNVDSTVLNIKLNKKNNGIDNENLFLEVLRASFAMRRKKLLNNLEKYGKDKVKQALIDLSINENVRAEELDLEDFKKISNILNKN